MVNMTLKRTLTNPSECYLNDKQISAAKYGQLACMAHVNGYDYCFGSSGGVDFEMISAPLTSLVRQYQRWVSVLTD